MIFEDLYKIVDESASPMAFDEGECVAFYEVLEKLPQKAVVVEIGVQYGRSTSLISQFAKEKDFDFSAVDAWCEGVSMEAKENIEKQIEKYGWKNTKIYPMSSHYFRSLWDGRQLDLVHIDGNHLYEFVLLDTQDWLPLVKVGGYACFDDYGHDSLPGVHQAVSEYMQGRDDWEFIGRFSNKFGIFKKIK